MTRSRYREYLDDPRTIPGDLATTLANYGLAPHPQTQRRSEEPLTLADLPTNDHNE